MSQTIVTAAELHPSGATAASSAHPRLSRTQDGISAFCGVLAGGSLIAITVLTVVEVVARSIFGSPLGWNVALVEQYLMMSMAFFGTVTAYRTGAHVAVVTLYDKFSPRLQKLFTLLSQLVVLSAFLCLAYAGADGALFALRMDEAPVPGMAELPLPTWWWKSIMPTAALLGAVIVVIDLYLELTGSWRAPVTDAVADPLADALVTKEN